MRVLITFVMLLITALPALAAVPSIPKNTPYHEARPRLLAMGYTPAKFKQKPTSCLPYDERCTQYPEAEWCSGTGSARCNFLWRSKKGELIEILTHGEEYLFIKEIRCRSNCKKSKIR